MKRPLIIIGLTILLSYLVAFSYGIGIMMLVIIPIAILVYRKVENKFNRNFMVIFIVLVIPLAFYLNTTLHFDGYYDLDEVVTISGTVTDMVLTSEVTTLQVSVNSINDSDITRSFEIKLYYYEGDSFYPGDSIVASVKLYALENTDYFSGKNYYYSRNILFTGYIKTLYEHDTITDYRTVLFAAKKWVQSSILTHSPDDAYPILYTMITADKTYISDDIDAVFSKISISHILAVSGLHISILCGVLLFILNKLRMHRKLISIVTLIAIWLFIAMIAFPTSAVRAGIMITIMLMGNVIGRGYDTLNSLGGAIIIATMINPYAAVDIGFLLSVFSVLGIGLFYSALYAYLKGKIKLPKLILQSVALTLSVNVMLIPILIYTYGKISTVFIIANVILIPLITAMLMSGIVLALFGFILPVFIYQPLYFTIGMLIKIIMAIATFLANLPFSCIPFSFTGIIIIYVVVTISYLLYRYKRVTKKVAKIIGLTLSIIVISHYYITDYTAVKVAIYESDGTYTVGIAYKDCADLYSISPDYTATASVKNFISKSGIEYLAAYDKDIASYLNRSYTMVEENNIPNTVVTYTGKSIKIVVGDVTIEIGDGEILIDGEISEANVIYKF